MAAQSESVSSSIGLGGSPYRLKFIGGQDSIDSYCTRMIDRCHQWSITGHGRQDFQDPLMICDVILEGLPSTYPWKEVKDEYPDLVISRKGRLMPNHEEYILKGVYMVTPEFLRSKLKTWEMLTQAPKEDPIEEDPIEEDPEEDPMEEEIPEKKESNAPIGFRSPIPSPDDLADVDMPEEVIYHPGLETLKEYCDYIEKLCNNWSLIGLKSYKHPLSICYYILNGLPSVSPWKELKDEFDDLLIENLWGDMVPNDSKYKDREYDVYVMDPPTLLGRLKSIAMKDAEAKHEAGSVLRKLEKMDKKEIAKKIHKAWRTIDKNCKDCKNTSDIDCPKSPQYTPASPQYTPRSPSPKTLSYLCRK